MRVGWNLLGRQYRIQSKITAYLMALIDAVLSALLMWSNNKRFQKRFADSRIASIVVIRNDHIGDMILTSSFFRNLKQAYPKAKIHVLCRSSTKSIINMFPTNVSPLVLDTPWFARGTHVGWRRTISFCKKHWRVFDLAFDLHGDPRNILLASAIAKHTVGFGTRGLGPLLHKEVPYKKVKHVVEQQLDLLRALGKKTDDGTLTMHISPSLKRKATNLLKKHNITTFILIQISAGSPARELSAASWKKILSRQTLPIVCCDPDKSKIDAIDPDGKIIRLTTDLPTYLAIISKAKKVISVESMAMHAATALNVPVIDLHSGQTLAQEWGPYGRNVRILQDRTCPLYPCGLDTCAYGKPSPCMEKIASSKRL